MTNRDKYHVLDTAGNRQLSLQKVCDIMGISVPERFYGLKDKIENHVSARLKDAREGCIHFIISPIKSEQDLLKRLERLCKKKCIAIFVEKGECEKIALDYEKYPVIPVEHVVEKATGFFYYMKELNEVKTVAVTGTCGKTTTMKFLKPIVSNAFQTFMNEGNANSYMSVAKHIMTELTPEHEMYIQEVGAADVNSVRKAAQMLRVDAFVLLNVFNHHSNMYGSPEGILEDKVSLDDYMKDGGVAIINYDDERLSSYSFKHDIVTFGIDTEKKVDYRAVNIVQNGAYLDLDIEYEEKKVHITVNILGVHNAYNVLAAFALSRFLGISEEEIVKGFRQYKSLGFRQNYCNIGGYNLLLDCYNVCEDSLKADIKTMKSLESGDNRKIAVVTGENKLGKDAYKISFELGQSLDISWLDYIVVVGPEDETQDNIDYYCHGRALYEGICSTGFSNITYVTNPVDMEREIRKVARVGDLILFKGMYNMDLIPVIDSLFGTDLAMNNPYYIKQAKKVENKRFELLEFPVLNSLDIIGVVNQNARRIKIPDYVDSVPVFRIKQNLCKNNQSLRKLDLGKAAVHIGASSFEGCSGLKKIVIPGNVKVIGKRAFKGCTNLKKLIIEEGVRHIEEEAFADCLSLSKVIIPKSVENIHPKAFPDSIKL